MIRITQKVLFLCTGNYFRSRYAEVAFNHFNQNFAYPWQADSRGLALERLEASAGPISPYTLKRVQDRGICAPAIERMPMPVKTEDLDGAGLIIALKAAEHRPLIRTRHPEWENKIEYWSVDDIDFVPPEHALDLIEAEVQKLLHRLAHNGSNPLA